MRSLCNPHPWALVNLWGAVCSSLLSSFQLLFFYLFSSTQKSEVSRLFPCPSSSLHLRPIPGLAFQLAHKHCCCHLPECLIDAAVPGIATSNKPRKQTVKPVWSVVREINKVICVSIEQIYIESLLRLVSFLIVYHIPGCNNLFPGVYKWI